VIARWVAALDFWLQFSARLARRPAAWIVLHRLLSVPLLLRLPRRTLASSGVIVTTRVRSPLAWLLPDPGSSSGAPDLDVVQVHPWMAWWWRRRGRVIVPTFVRYRGRVEEIPPPRPSKSLRANLTKAERNGFVARPGDEWGLARRMAEDWARGRFGEDVWMPPEHAWGRMRRHGRLLTISDGTRDVAVAVVIAAHGGREAWFTALGLAEGDPELLRAGAITAVYAAVADDARAIGAATIDSGRCYARGDDPIGEYKARWGYRPVRDPFSPVFAVRALSEAGSRFLADAPLIRLARI
jgi:hypothetical protein